MPILFRLFRDSKNTIHFYVRQVEMQKNISKIDVITFTRLFGNCTSKNKDIGLKIRMRVVYTYFDDAYSFF